MIGYVLTRLVGFNSLRQTLRTPDGTSRQHALRKYLSLLQDFRYTGTLFLEYKFAERDERWAATLGLAYFRTLVASFA